MNIGIVCYPTYGGSGVIATELGKYLAEKGHQVHFVTYSRPIRLGQFRQNISFHEVSVRDYPLFEFPPYETALTSTLVDVALHHDLDLLHVHYAIPHAAAAVTAKRILATMGKEIAVITTLHGTDTTLVGKDKSYLPVVKYSLNESDGVTVVSEFLRQETSKTFETTTAIERIPNFVDVDRFTRQDKEHFRKMVAPNDEKLIIHTSNFRKVKRVEDVIHTFYHISKALPSRLVMVGDGPERVEAERLSRELELQDDVIFVGSQNPVEEIYSVGDLFLMPSESESFGLSALEAMACGVPCVTSDAGGLREFNIDGKTGFVCKVGDVESMGAKSIELLKDPEAWEAMSVNARNQAHNFHISKIVPQYEAYYESILKLAVPA